MQMGPGTCGYPAAIKWLPSADDAIVLNKPCGTAFDVQVAPELVERKTDEPPKMTAANLLPSAEEVAEAQNAVGTLFDDQFTPPLVEVQSTLDSAALTHLLPSADEAMERNRAGVLNGVQVFPESAELQSPPFHAIATNLVPSADAATPEYKFVAGTLAWNQSLPELVEIKMAPEKVLTESWRPAAATRIVPSAEEATDCQLVMGALVCVQV